MFVCLIDRLIDWLQVPDEVAEMVKADMARNKGRPDKRPGSFQNNRGRGGAGPFRGGGRGGGPGRGGGKSFRGGGGGPRGEEWLSTFSTLPIHFSLYA